MKHTLFCLLLLTFEFTFAVKNIVPIKIESDKQQGCAPLAVNFSARSQEKDATWLWDFGNGYTSDLKNPSVAFLKPGIYNVNLFLNSKAGIASASMVIKVNASPKADFILDLKKTCVDDQISLTNLSTAGETPIIRYVWGFGDGQTSTELNAAHKYANEGNYNITLVTTDANGCTADKTSYSAVHVNARPTANFTSSIESSCSETQVISFSNQSSGINNTYTWDFGDNAPTSSETSPSHLFNQGKYNVILTVKDENQCVQTEARKVSITKLKAGFTASKETSCTGEVVKFVNTSNYKGTNWSWEFGDGTVSAECNPEKTYLKSGDYAVRFTITDGACSETVKKASYMHVGPGKPVTFTSNVTASCISPMAVQFKNTTPNTALPFWEFGDGTFSMKANPEKVFNVAGNYTVSLSVTDSSGCVFKKEVENYIQTSKPLVNFTGDIFGCAGYPVRFTNFTPNATSFVWNFGDGDTSTKKNPSHVYRKNGYYTVSLTGRNGEGCDSTITFANFVHIDTIKVDFEIATAASAVPPFVCNFINKTVPADVKYIWDFGDGSTETSVNPTHLYDIPGNFNVRLVAHSRSGCSNSKVVQNSFQIGTSFNPAIVHTGL